GSGRRARRRGRREEARRGDGLVRRLQGQRRQRVLALPERRERAVVAAALLALAAGAAGAIQVAVQSRLGERVGLLPATLFSALVSSAIGLVLVLAVHRSLAGVGRSLQQTPVLWIGGAMGVLIVFTFAYGGPRIGTA